VDIAPFIRDVPDWPKEGVIFKDITPLTNDPEAFRGCIDAFVDHFGDKGVTKVIGAEARGFIFGAPIAYALGAGFVPARKPGKLPWNVSSVVYDLEYGTDELQIHTDGIVEGDRVLIFDDVLAPGGTASAKVEFVSRKGAELVGLGFVLELDFLNGREKLPGDADILTLLHVE